MRKESNTKHKFNIMDAIVILLILVCIISIVWRSVSIKESYQPKEYLLYFEIDDIKNSSYAFFDGHFGENVRIKDSGEILGTLGDNFKRGEAIHTYTENMDGDVTNNQYYHPEASEDLSFSYERCSISGYIVVSGEMTKDGFLINDKTLLIAGQEIKVVTEYIETTIRIVSIEKK